MTLALVFSALALWLVIGGLVTQELRSKGIPIPAGRGFLVALTWPLALVIEAFRS